MNHEGDLSILSRLAKGDGRIGLMALSGFMCGADGGGRASAFENWGLTQNFKVFVGISTGAPVMLYTAGGVVTRGHRVYFTESATPRFISWSPRRFLQGTSADMSFQRDIYLGKVGSNPADFEAMFRHQGDVCVGVTDYESGEGLLVDVKKASPHPVEAVHASIAVPLLYRQPVFVNGRRGTDGGIGVPFPAKEVIARWNLDGLIVFANRPNIDPTLRWKMGEYLYTKMLPKQFHSPMRARPQRYRNALQFLRDGRKRGDFQYLLFWSQPFRTVTRRAHVIETLAKDAYEHTEELFLRAGI